MYTDSHWASSGVFSYYIFFLAFIYLIKLYSYLQSKILILAFVHCSFFFSFCHRAALGEACNGDTTFADSLEGFGGDLDDPISVAIGGCWVFFNICFTSLVLGNV